MRKKWFFFLVLFLFILSGCGKKKEIVQSDTLSDFAEKIDKDKDYIYFEDVKKMLLNSGEEYLIQYPIVNLSSKESNSVNLELKSIVNKNYRTLKIENDRIQSGNLLFYEFFESDKYLSLVQSKKYYLNNAFFSDDIETYVFDKKNGSLLNKEQILQVFNYDSTSFLNKVSQLLDGDDASYTLMMIKQNDYSLYVKENRLVLVYYETDDEHDVKKEMVIVD